MHGSDAQNVTSDRVLKRRYQQESMYVELFQDMLRAVLEKESHLFTASEHACFSFFFQLHYDARYLFVRLLQRKKGQWYRLDKLEYNDVEDLSSAARALSQPFAASNQIEPYRFSMMDGDIKGNILWRLELLTVDELKLLAKRLGKKSSGTRDTLLKNLTAKPTNAVLFSQQHKLSMNMQPTHDRLLSYMADIMHGGCICLDSTVYALMERLAFVYYRGKPVLGSLLTSAVLSRTGKYTFPTYVYMRDSSMFPDRDCLLRYEEATQLVEHMDAFVEGMKSSLDSARACLPLLDTCEPAWREATHEMRSVYPVCVPRDRCHLLRFHYGWALTRVLFKGCECLARLGMHDRESHILKQLLSQRYFWRGRRGSWYERLSILVARHDSKQHALVICQEALHDPDTHVTYTFSLQRRIARLESQLKIPKSARQTFVLAHREPRVVEFEGVRVNGRLVQPRNMLRQTVLTFDARIPKPTTSKERKSGGRTQWQSTCGTSCTVEQYCLEQYALQGYRGYHCEGGILLFVFVLLMWDVLFLSVPGAFETPYQRAPMDLGTDIFLEARKEAIEAQLHRIQETGGCDIIHRVDARERPKRTHAIGCRWDEFPIHDVMEVAECIGGTALAALCRILCENGASTTGFPDLTLWRYQDRQVRFVEVKSPKDRLNEPQKVWMDALLSAGVAVDLAKVRITSNEAQAT